MGLIVDTCFLIDCERGKNIELSSELLNEPFFISAITFSELKVGLHVAKNIDIVAKRKKIIEEMLQDITILAFDEAIAELHAQYSADLLQQKTLIGPHDLIIAATAAYYQYPVLTRNVREFSRIKDLQVIEYFIQPEKFV